MGEVSVIIPIFNAEKYLRRCLDSVINQSYNNIEIILVDDGSKDSSPAICDEYAAKDSRIKVIHKKNQGVSAARNTGIETAKGEFLVFLDADDYLSLNCIECLAKYSDYDFVICAYQEFGYRELVKGPKGVTKIDVKKDIPILWNKSYSPYWLYVWGKLFKTNVVKDNKLSYDPEMKYLEDFCFVLRYMSCITKACLIDNILVYHLVEISKYSKYHMPYEVFKDHIVKQDTCFNILEKKCGNRKFVLMREKVFNRHFYNFKDFLICEKAPFWIKYEEAKKYMSEENSMIYQYINKKGWKIVVYYYIWSLLMSLMPKSCINKV